MPTGAITGYIDVAQLVLYAFWIFFFALIFYIRREDKREGYPLESERTDPIPVEGFPPVPPKKVFRLQDGSTHAVPRDSDPQIDIKAEPLAVWPGAPLEPTGNAMRESVGPASYAQRADVPAMTLEGEPMIVPLRVADDFYLEGRDPDPRGMPVIAADGASPGNVVEVWIDRVEPQVHFLEVQLESTGQRVLLPMDFAVIERGRRRVRVASITADQFAHVPAVSNPDQITLLEEDKITAYFAGGTLYAKAERPEPLL